ncbi:MAG: ATP-binding protein [Pseudomonadota bacterium]
MSFRLKTILGIAMIEMSVMAILILVNQLNLGGTARAQLFERVNATGEVFATMVADAVISTDLATLDAMIENTLSNDELVYLRVRNNGGIALSAGGDAGALEQPFVADPAYDQALPDNRIDLSLPIQIAGQSYGSIELGVSTLAVEAEMAKALQWNLAVAGMGICLVAIFGYLLGSVLTVQLSSLQRGAQMIARGDLETRIGVRGRDELAETARCFNDMAQSLAEERVALESKQAELVEKKDHTDLIVEVMRMIAKGETAVEVPDADRADEIGDMARATVVFQNSMDENRAAREEQARLIHAFDQLEEQVVLYDTNERAIFLNTAFYRFNEAILEQLPEDFTRQQFLEEGLRQGSYPSAVGRETEWLEMRLHCDPEDDVPIEVHRAPDRVLLVRQTHVADTGIIVSASDVTELKKSQAQLVQASKLATLGEMATGVAHELNQPLGVIRMASNNCMKRIAKGQLDAEYLTSKLQRMADQTERASQIINHMRIFGRKADGEERTFELRASLENAAKLMGTQLSDHSIALRRALGEADVFVTGQQVMFEQVILNLFSNARDAIMSTETGASEGGEISVQLETHDADTISVIVEDSGGGIPEAVLDRLFDPFFTTKEPGKGTGLGLSISYGIIGEMNGTIGATNTDRGARFRIDLPRAEGAAQDAAA